MGNLVPQIIINCSVLAVLLLAMLVPILWPVSGRKRWQFNLRIFLFFMIPLFAAVAWIMSWEGPYFSSRRVVTPKFGALILLVDFAGVVFFFRWLRAMTRMPRGTRSTDSTKGST
jgi:hypothetical protein